MLEMCDQMMSVLDEHGGARNKYIKMKDKETEIANKKADYYSDVAKSMRGSASALASDKSDYYKDKASKSARDASIAAFGYDQDEGHRSSDYHNKVKDDFYRMCNSSLEGKQEFMKKYGGPSGKKLGHDKPGEIKALQDKKRAIKETCLNILSIIDEL